MKLSTRTQLLKEAKKTIQRINEAEDINALKQEAERLAGSIIEPIIKKSAEDVIPTIDPNKVSKLKIDVKSIVASLPNDAKKIAEELTSGLKTESIFSMNLSSIASILTKVTSVGKVALKIFSMSNLKMMYASAKDTATKFADKLVSSPKFINIVKKTGVLTAVTTLSPIIAKACAFCGQSPAEFEAWAKRNAEIREAARLAARAADSTANPQDYIQHVAKPLTQEQSLQQMADAMQIFLVVIGIVCTVLIIVFIVNHIKFRRENDPNK